VTCFFFSFLSFFSSSRPGEGGVVLCTKRKSLSFLFFFSLFPPPFPSLFPPPGSRRRRGPVRRNRDCASHCDEALGRARLGSGKNHFFFFFPPPLRPAEVRSPCDALFDRPNLQAPTGRERRPNETKSFFFFFPFFFLLAQSDSSVPIFGTLVDYRGAGVNGVHITAHPGTTRRTPRFSFFSLFFFFLLPFPPRPLSFPFKREIIRET